MASSLFLIEYSQQSGLVMLGKEFFKVRKWSSAPLMKCGITASVDGSVETQIKSGIRRLCNACNRGRFSFINIIKRRGRWTMVH